MGKQLGIFGEVLGENVLPSKAFQHFCHFVVRYHSLLLIAETLCDIVWLT